VCVRKLPQDRQHIKWRPICVLYFSNQILFLPFIPLAWVRRDMLHPGAVRSHGAEVLLLGRQINSDTVMAPKSFSVAV